MIFATRILQIAQRKKTSKISFYVNALHINIAVQHERGSGGISPPGMRAPRETAKTKSEVAREHARNVPTGDALIKASVIFSRALSSAQRRADDRMSQSVFEPRRRVE